MRKVFKLKLILFSVILLSVAHCDKLENDEETEITEDDQNDAQPASVKTKRGIYNYGHGSALSYSIPPTANYGYHRSYLSTPHSRFPGAYRSLPSHGPVAIAPGGASVYSYNANYPRHNVLANRPVIPVGRPAFIPSLAPFAPTPAVFAPPKPIIPVAYPSYANRFPVVFQQPYTPFAVQRPLSFVPPVAPALPAAPFLPAPAPFPFPAAPFPAAAAFPSAPFPTAPISPFSPINPVVGGFHPFPINPQLIPIPTAQPTIPTSANIPESFPQPGFFSPDGWRPVIVNQPTPGISTIPTTPATTTTTSLQPSNDLLPPYLQPASSNSPDIQTTPQIPDNTYLPQKPPNNYYLTPTEGTTLDQSTQQQYSNEQLAQAQERYEHQQQQQAYQLQQHLQNLHQEQQYQQQLQQSRRSRNRGSGSGRHTFVSSLASQGYESASNNGRYSGPSSYDVALGSRTRLHK